MGILDAVFQATQTVVEYDEVIEAMEREVETRMEAEAKAEDDNGNSHS